MNPLPRESEPVGGVGVDDLPVGAVLDVETANTHYRIENRGAGKVLISGHPDICPDPTRASAVEAAGRSCGRGTAGWNAYFHPNNSTRCYVTSIEQICDFRQTVACARAGVK